MQEEFITKRFRAESLVTISTANDILEEYDADGYTLTLRQLYYQFVARGFIENTERSYKNLGSLVSDARMAGLIDWGYMTDRTRSLSDETTWTDVSDALSTMVGWYSMDKWSGQEIRPEVWVEKDALIGIINKACAPYQVGTMSCRGFPSQSVLYEAAQRITRRFGEEEQVTEIIHLGDHDPSGVDMTRDIIDRLNTMTYGGVDSGMITVNRIALSMDQVRKFDPPPNPAKLTDSRAAKYVEKFGYESWELDALQPQYMVELIRQTIKGCMDQSAWEDAEAREEEGRDRLRELATEE